MNLVGKIFAILVLVMSVLFMGLAVAVYSTHRNWELLVTNPTASGPNLPKGLKPQLDEALEANRKAAARLVEVQDEYAAQLAMRQDQIAKLQTELANVRNEYDAIFKQQADLQTQLREALAAMSAAQSTLGERLATETQLKQDLDAARAEATKHFNESVALTDRVNQALNEVDQLKQSSSRLSKQLADARVVMDRHGIPANAPVSGLPPRVDGYVLASDPNGLVEISIGSDDGLARGHTLEVFRMDEGGTAPKYLGRIEVLQAAPDKAVAKVLPEYRKGSIAANDRVATRLN